MPDSERPEYTFYGNGPMIEFTERTERGRRTAVIHVDDIQGVYELEGDSTSVVLENGRIVLADHPYRELRRIILEARSQFATLL